MQNPKPVLRDFHFPVKLYQVLEMEDDSIIRWEDDGKSIHILDQERFEQEILPKYFRHCRFASMQRQLNLYGFKSVNRGEEKGVFCHPQFLRGDFDGVRAIRRLHSQNPTKTAVFRKRRTTPTVSPRTEDPYREDAHDRAFRLRSGSLSSEATILPEMEAEHAAREEVVYALLNDESREQRPSQLTVAAIQTWNIATGNTPTFCDIMKQKFARRRSNTIASAATTSSIHYSSPYEDNYRAEVSTPDQLGRNQTATSFKNGHPISLCVPPPMTPQQQQQQQQQLYSRSLPTKLNAFEMPKVPCVGGNINTGNGSTSARSTDFNTSRSTATTATTTSTVATDDAAPDNENYLLECDPAFFDFWADDEAIRESCIVASTTSSSDQCDHENNCHGGNYCNNNSNNCCNNNNNNNGNVPHFNNNCNYYYPPTQVNPPYSSCTYSDAGCANPMRNKLQQLQQQHQQQQSMSTSPFHHPSPPVVTPTDLSHHENPMLTARIYPTY